LSGDYSSSVLSVANRTVSIGFTFVPLMIARQAVGYLEPIQALIVMDVQLRYERARLVECTDVQLD
jgi:hypothetical protein